MTGALNQPDDQTFADMRSAGKAERNWVLQHMSDQTLITILEAKYGQVVPELHSHDLLVALILQQEYPE